MAWRGIKSTEAWWMDVSVCLTPSSVALSHASPWHHLTKLSYLDAELLRTGQRWLQKCFTFAARVHANEAFALALDILKVPQRDAALCVRAHRELEILIRTLRASLKSPALNLMSPDNEVRIINGTGLKKNQMFGTETTPSECSKPYRK